MRNVMAVKKDCNGDAVAEGVIVGIALADRDGDAPDRSGVGVRVLVADAVDALVGVAVGGAAPLLEAHLPTIAAAAMAGATPTPVFTAAVGATGTVTALARLTSDTICTSAQECLGRPPDMQATAARSRAALLASAAMPAAEEELVVPPAAYSVKESDMPKGASGAVPATGVAEGLRETGDGVRVAMGRALAAASALAATVAAFSVGPTCCDPKDTTRSGQANRNGRPMAARHCAVWKDVAALYAPTPA